MMNNIKAKESAVLTFRNTSRHYYRATELVLSSNFNIRVPFFDGQPEAEDQAIFVFSLDSQNLFQP
jgi:hypothetical protein